MGRLIVAVFLCFRAVVLDTFVTDIRAVRTLEHDLHVRALGAAERAAVAAVLVVVLILCHAVYLSRLESTSSISP